MMMTVMLLAVSCCAAGLVGAKSIQHEHRPHAAEPKLLYFLSEGKLWRLDLAAGNNASLVTEQPVVDYDLDADRPYWIDRTGQVLSNPGGARVFTYYPAVSGARIAHDGLSGKFYVLDGESQEVDVLDSRGQNQSVLFERQPVREEHVVREKPRRLVLDPPRGIMFILTDLNGVKNIYRSNMDGTSIKLLISNVGSDELDVDHHNKRIFWANGEQKVIESANYDGDNRVPVVKIQNPVAVTVHNNQLIWSTTEKASSVIRVCKLREDACDPATSRLVSLGSSHQLRRLHSLKLVRPPSKAANPCQVGNGGCGHLCLLTASGPRRSCACPVGWLVAEDGRTCRQRTGNRPKRQMMGYDMYSQQQQPTLRPEPQPPQQQSQLGIPIIFYGK